MSRLQCPKSFFDLMMSKICRNRSKSFVCFSNGHRSLMLQIDNSVPGILRTAVEGAAKRERQRSIPGPPSSTTRPKRLGNYHRDLLHPKSSKGADGSYCAAFLKYRAGSMAWASCQHPTKRKNVREGKVFQNSCKKTIDSVRFERSEVLWDQATFRSSSTG